MSVKTSLIWSRPAAKADRVKSNLAQPACLPYDWWSFVPAQVATFVLSASRYGQENKGFTRRAENEGPEPRFGPCA